MNAVAPGEITTEMIDPEYEMLIPRIPLNRGNARRCGAQFIIWLRGGNLYHGGGDLGHGEHVLGLPSATKTQLEFVPEYSEPVESLFKALDVVFEPLGKMAASWS